MGRRTELPDSFLRELDTLENKYLEHDDPIRQSGFGGGAQRWREEREPILNAIESDGDLLDVGCANGYLVECLVIWGRERGLDLTPYGLDYGRRLIALAKKRLPQIAGHFYVGNAWDWKPPKKFRFVYSLYDCVPLDYFQAYIERLLKQVVAPKGRLIVGAYGSRSRNIPPIDLNSLIRSAKYSVTGTSEGGTPPITKFAWIDNE
jgi:SAM-dependent methyltransferase